MAADTVTPAFQDSSLTVQDMSVKFVWCDLPRALGHFWPFPRIVSISPVFIAVVTRLNESDPHILRAHCVEWFEGVRVGRRIIALVVVAGLGRLKRGPGLARRRDKVI